MLLYSSQVSVAISSFIAFIFTVALFLSGYILQQKTLRDLRAELRPQISRNLHGTDLYYLPSQDERENTRLEKWHWNLKRGTAERRGEEKYPNLKYADDRNDDMLWPTKWQRRLNYLQKQTQAAAVRSQKEGLSPAMSRAERRKLIRSQILTEGEVEKPQSYRRRRV